MSANESPLAARKGLVKEQRMEFPHKRAAEPTLSPSLRRTPGRGPVLCQILVSNPPASLWCHLGEEGPQVDCALLPGSSLRCSPYVSPHVPEVGHRGLASYSTRVQDPKCVLRVLTALVAISSLASFTVKDTHPLEASVSTGC